MGRKIESFVGGKDGYKAYENAEPARNDRNGLLPAQIPHRRRQDVGHERLGDQDWIVLRYAEVLLNKAEALAMENWNKNSAEALQALNDVRARVGLPARATADKETFLNTCVTNARWSWPAKVSATGPAPLGGWPKKSSTAERARR